MNKKEQWEIVKLIREKTPRGWIWMSSNSIGEVLIICALARGMIEKYGYPITLCVRPDHVKLVELLYPNRFTAVIAMDQGLMRSFSDTGFIPEDRFDIDFPIHLSPLHYQDGLLLDLHNLLFKRKGISGLDMTDVFRCMLRLDWDVPLEKPCMDFFLQENPSVTSLGIDVTSNTSALLQPGNNTNKPLPAYFWQLVEDRLAEQNYRLYANIKGAMLADSTLRFKHAELIKLDITDALYMAYHSGTVVSVMNGLINSAVFLDFFDHPGPIIHGIMTDKYCKHYNLIRTDWEAAFVDFDSPPSTWMGGREAISDSAKFFEWRIGTSLNEADYETAATSVLNQDRKSPFYVCSHLEDTPFNFPQPKNFNAD